MCAQVNNTYKPISSKFCYLGEMLGEEGGPGLVVANRVGRWKFNVLPPCCAICGVGERKVYGMHEELYVVW